MRSALICSAYSIAEAAIVGLAPKLRAGDVEVRQAYQLGAGRVAKLYKVQFAIQSEARACNSAQWDREWSDLHRLRLLRNTLVHEGGIGHEGDLIGASDRNDGFGVWIESMFEDVEAGVSVLVVGDTHFRLWMQRLQRVVLDVDADLHGAAGKQSNKGGLWIFRRADIQ